MLIRIYNKPKHANATNSLSTRATAPSARAPLNNFSFLIYHPRHRHCVFALGALVHHVQS